ncbi:hypothetical protein BTM478_15480 [Helicobacter pylori]
MLDNALESGTAEAIAGFLKHAYEQANVSYSERELLIDLGIINEIVCYRQQKKQGE